MRGDSALRTILLALVAVSSVCAYQRKVTLDHTKVAVGITGYQCLVSVSDSSLKTVANGGHVNNSPGDGSDIFFAADPFAYTRYRKPKIISYDPVNGVYNAWVYLPSISTTSDLVFYMFYGLSSTPSLDTTAVWSNYSASWDLGDGTTLSAADSSGNGNNGTLNGPPTATTGQYDGAANFTGGSQTITVPHSASLDSWGSLTISFWANYSSSSGQFARLIEKGTNNEMAVFVNATAGSGKISFQSSNGTNFLTTASSYAGAWHKFDVVWTSTTAVNLYVDGVNVTSGTAAVSASGTHDLAIAGQGTGAGLTGSMEGVRWIKTNLSTNEIVTRYHNESAPGNIGSANFLAYGPETGNTTPPSITLPAGYSLQWSGPWDYVTANGGTADGDTWSMMPTVNGIRVTCNDCTGINSSNNSNAAFFTESNDLGTITLKNGLTGYGTKGDVSIGACDSGETVKTYPPRSYNGLYVLPIFCQGGSNPFAANSGTYAFSTSSDDGAHWFRAEDAVSVTAGSCTTGTVTLTTSGAPPSTGVGILVLAHNIGVAADGVYTTIAGTSGTTVKFSATCTGAFTAGSLFSGGTGTTANAIPWSTVMWAGGSNTMQRRAIAQICADNVGCSATPNSTDTYLVGVSSDGTGNNPIAFRVLKSDMDTAPGDATKYTFWTDGSNFSGTQANATSLVCNANGVLKTCPMFRSLVWMTDSSWTNGGFWLATSDTTPTGQVGIYISPDNFWGPYTVAVPLIPTFSPALQYNYANTLPQLYTPAASGHGAFFRLQNGGNFGTSQYWVSHFDVGIAQMSAAPSITSPYPGVAGPGGPFGHIGSGLVAYWPFVAYGDQSVSPDYSPSALNLAGTSFTAFQTGFVTSPYGLTNFDPTSLGFTANSISTGFGSNLADFTVEVIAKSTGATLPQTLLCAQPGGGNNGFCLQYVTGPHFQVGIRNGATMSALNCPDPAANTTFAYIIERKGGTVYCFSSTAIGSPTSGGTDSTALGTYTLQLGSDTTPNNYWRGDVGSVLIWNRALCSTQISGSCSAGQVDEVVREFATIHRESVSRGWGL